MTATTSRFCLPITALVLVTAAARRRSRPSRRRRRRRPRRHRFPAPAAGHAPPATPTSVPPAPPPVVPDPGAVTERPAVGRRRHRGDQRQLAAQAGVLRLRQRRARRRGAADAHRERRGAQEVQHVGRHVEGHCDERGTAEYNLALGDRRALAAKNYLVSLGIAADRLRTVSYGKEFPFDPGPRRDGRGRRTAARTSC